MLACLRAKNLELFLCPISNCIADMCFEVNTH